MYQDQIPMWFYRNYTRVCDDIFCKHHDHQENLGCQILVAYTTQGCVTIYCQFCKDCQHIGNLENTNITKLVTTLPTKPFKKWVIDFIGPIKPLG